MNRDLIARHQRIIAKVEEGEPLGRADLQLIGDANETHLNDEQNLAGRHAEARKLDAWLKSQKRLTREQAMVVLEEHLRRDSKTPATVFEALHVLWEEEARCSEQQAREKAFDDGGSCLKCGSKVSLADATDTVVFVGQEIVKRHDGDITNRNCLRCTYPKLYPEYRDYDE